MANWFEKLLAFPGAEESGESFVGLLSKGIARHSRERLRIQPRRQGNKYADTQYDRFRDAKCNRHRFRFGFIAAPRVHSDAQVGIRERQRRQRDEPGYITMPSFQKRMENKITA